MGVEAERPARLSMQTFLARADIVDRDAGRVDQRLQGHPIGRFVAVAIPADGDRVADEQDLQRLGASGLLKPEGDHRAEQASADPPEPQTHLQNHLPSHAWTSQRG